MGRGECSGFTVPAVNIRGLTYDTARALFRSALKNKAGAIIFEIAKSEMGYTDQSPYEYSTVVIAAAVKEGYKGPIFIQGDHFQINPKNYAQDREKEIAGLRELIKKAVGAGFYNIDIDASTVVDLSKGHVVEQQTPNFETTAELTKFIRDIEPNGITISIGGEIGEVGVGRAGLDGPGLDAPPSYPRDERRVEVPLEPGNDLAPVLDGLDEVLRIRMEIDREVLSRPVQLGEHAPQGLRKGGRGVFHPRGLDHSPAAPRRADPERPACRQHPDTQPRRGGGEQEPEGHQDRRHPGEPARHGQ